MLIAAANTNPLASLAPLVLLGGVFYLLLIRPQQRRAKAQKALLSSIEVGDDVMTGGGMFGHIVDIDDDDDVVTLEIADGVHVRIIRAGIGRRIENFDDDDDTQGDNYGTGPATTPSIDQPDQSKEL
jgi:preprotein translocase subunit YajC